MVGETPKPFACTSEGCTMTFTNEDHLNVHQRKHEMVLNLGIKSSSIVADQTPTPTRFLRNCEEVGLFQDLQNVNPFEETFRKAVEMVKTGSLPVPDLPEDDTLHTPHVFPHIPEDNSCIYTDNNKRNAHLAVEATEIISEKTVNVNNDIADHMYAVTYINLDKNPVILINDKSVPTLDNSTEIKKEDTILKTKKQSIVSINKDKYRKYSHIKSDNLNATKLKLQQILQSKQVKTVESKNNVAQPIIVVQGLKIANSHVSEPAVVNNIVPVLPIESKNTKTTVIQSNNCKSSNNDDTNMTKKLDLLERNRAAATRCRARKKMWIGSLENKFSNVCKEKQELEKEVHNLRNEIIHLKTLLLAHKDCPVTKAMNMGQNIPIGPPRIVAIQTTATPKESLSETVNTSNKISKNVPVIIKPNNAAMAENIPFAKNSKTNVIVLNNTLIQ